LNRSITPRPTLDNEVGGSDIREPASVSDRDILAIDVLLSIVKRKWLIAKVTLAVTVLTIIIVLLIPRSYVAKTSILPPEQNQSLTAAMMGQLGSVAALAGKDFGLKNPSDAYVLVLRSNSIGEQLIRRFDLMRVYRTKNIVDTLKALADHAEIKDDKSGVITIEFEDKDPKRAADVANGYVEDLRQVMKGLSVTEASQRRAFFEQQVGEAKEQLAGSEADLRGVEEKTGLIQLDSQAKAIIQQIANVREQIAAREVRLQGMRSYATADNPYLQRTERELGALRSELSKLEHQTNTGAGDTQVPTAGMPSASLDYLRKLRELKYNEMVFEVLSKQYELAKLDEAKETTMVQVFDPATVPDKPTKPRRSLIVLGVFLGTLLLMSLWSIAADLHARAKQDTRYAAKLQLLRSYAAARMPSPSTPDNREF
jgi:tyrosine-protein kinase Etk/Wzc